MLTSKSIRTTTPATVTEIIDGLISTRAQLQQHDARTIEQRNPPLLQEDGNTVLVLHDP